MYSLLSYLSWGVSVVAMSSLSTSLVHVSMERMRVQNVALSFNPHSHFLTPTHTQTHTHTCTHISEGSHQFSRPPAPRSLQPCTSPVGIYLFRRSYVNQEVTSSVAGQDGKALLLYTATSNVNLLDEWIHLSTLGKFTCSYGILIGCAWQWEDRVVFLTLARPNTVSASRYGTGDGKIPLFFIHLDPASDID